MSLRWKATALPNTTATMMTTTAAPINSRPRTTPSSACGRSHRQNRVIVLKRLPI